MDTSIQQQQQQQQHAGSSSTQGPQGAPGTAQSVQNGAVPSGQSHIMHAHLHPMLSRGHTHAHVFSANPNGTPTMTTVDPSQTAQQQVQSPQQSPGVNQDGTPIKRRPGRPKGSTKKNLLAGSPLPPKVKRPVGRPRKDGFPAGSVGPTRTKRERPAVATVPTVPMVYGPISNYPTVNYNYAINGAAPGAATALSPASFPIDPSLMDKSSGDDWSELARANPTGFLSTLLNALAAPNPVSSAGLSVEDAFKSHLVSLAPNTAQTQAQTQAIPSLYSLLKTFWLPCSPAYFSLTASTSTARVPSEHRFFYWDPQPLVFNGISCPACNAPLTNRGRITTGPIKIYDIEKPFFIVGCEYVCRSQTCAPPSSPEGRKFASTDTSILRSLPFRLKEEFPARLVFGDADAGCGANVWNWGAVGVSTSLWNLVMGAVRSGVNKMVVMKLISSVQHGVPELSSEPTASHSISVPVNHSQQRQSQQHQNLDDKMEVDEDDHDEEDDEADDDHDEEDDGPDHDHTSHSPVPNGDASQTLNSFHRPAVDNTVNDAPFLQNFVAYDAWREPTSSGLGVGVVDQSKQVSPPTVRSPPPPPTVTIQPPPPPQQQQPTHAPQQQQHQQQQPQQQQPQHQQQQQQAPQQQQQQPPQQQQQQQNSAPFAPYGSYPFSPYTYLHPPPLVNSHHIVTMNMGQQMHSPSPGNTVGPSNPSSSSLAPVLNNPSNSVPTNPSSNSGSNSNMNVQQPPPPVQPPTAPPATTTGPTKRSPRHCCKCGSQDCKGKGGRNFCMNGCQDCGKMDCKGRNSRRPDKKCSEGWM